MDKIEDIISKLTLLSIAEFGDYVLKKEIIYINNLYKEVLKDLEDKIKEKEIELDFRSCLEIKEGDKFVLYTILKI